MRVKLTQPGWTTLTGTLHDIAFINGMSDVLTLNQVRRVAMTMLADAYEDDGTTLIGQAGEQAEMVRSKPTRGAQPNYVAAETVRLDLDDFIVKTVSGATYTLVEADNNKMLDFTDACVVTIPASLSADFGCSLRQGGASQISVIADATVTVEEIDDRFKSEKRLAILTLARFPDGKFQLTGRTAA